jgi:hypothetical protein
MKTRVINACKLLARFALPSPILYGLWHINRRGQPRTELGNASDHRTICPQNGVRLEVYWADVRDVGRGPCVSLFVLLEEVMRLDCLGGTQGHMHINPDQISLVVGWDITPRYFFPPGSRQDHIDRAVFEITTNCVAALQSNQMARVRNFPINKKALADATLQMRAYMNELLERHEDARDLQPV